MDDCEISIILSAANKLEFKDIMNGEEESDEDDVEVQLEAEINSLKESLDSEKKVITDLDAEIAAEEALITEAEGKKAVIDHCDYRRRRALIPLHENDYKRMESIQNGALALQAATGLTFESFGVRSGSLRGYFENNASRLEYFSINTQEQNKELIEDTLWSYIEG